MANNVTDLGKVGITLKGEWNSSTSYERLDTVTYEGSLYIAVKDNVGSQPSESNTNWMLGAKHGEFTEQQLEDFKAEVVAESKEEMDDYTDDKKTELDTYTGTKKTELDTYEGTKEVELNTYASGLKDDFDSNATSKTNAFNANATSKTNDFDSNAVAKTTAFDTNASTKTSAFNDNATAKTTAFDENAEEKTGDFNDNVDEKTAEFDTHVEEKETEFDENVDSIQEQITDIQEFIDSELEQGITEKGTRADVNDSAKWHGELAPEGRTEQKQLSGKNLFDILAYSNVTDGARITIANNKLTLEAVSTGGAQFVSYVINGLDETKTYNFSFKAKKIVKGTDGDGRIRAYLAGSNSGESYKLIKYVDAANPEIGTEYSLSNNFTGYKYLRVYLYNNTSTPVTVGEKVEYYDIQLEEGSTATDYEEFVGGTASPNPDYPQEIRNVEGRSCRNLFHKDTTTTGYRIVWATGEPYAEPTAEISDFIEIKGDTDYILTNKCYIIAYDDAKQYLGSLTNTGIAKSNGITTSNFKLSNDVKYVKLLKYGGANNFIGFQMNEGNTLLPYEPYFEGKRLEFNVIGKNLCQAVYPGYYFIDNGILAEDNAYRTFIVKNLPAGDYIFSTNLRDCRLLRIWKDNLSSNISANRNTHAFTTSQAGKVMITVRNVSSTEITENVLGQIEEGTTATPYEEHKQQLIPFPLQDGQKLMEGDYLADDGVHHVMGQVVLDGTENWIDWSYTSDTYKGALLDNVVNYDYSNGTDIRGLCNLLDVEVGGKTTKECVGLRQSNDYSRVYISIKKERLTASSLTGIKNWLSANKPILQYKLKEEVIEPYTPAQAEAYNKLMNLLLYKGVNHIWTETDGVEPNLQLTYYKSNKERLNNIEARLELLEN